MLTDKELYQQAIKKWGAESQILLAIEEMSELIKALIKYTRKPDELQEIFVIEEMADVENMLEQLKEVFYCHERVREEKKKKLIRLESRLKRR